MHCAPGRDAGLIVSQKLRSNMAASVTTSTLSCKSRRRSSITGAGVASSPSQCCTLYLRPCPNSSSWPSICASLSTSGHAFRAMSSEPSSLPLAFSTWSSPYGNALLPITCGTKRSPTAFVVITSRCISDGVPLRTSWPMWQCWSYLWYAHLELSTSLALCWGSREQKNHSASFIPFDQQHLVTHNLPQKKKYWLRNPPSARHLGPPNPPQGENRPHRHLHHRQHVRVHQTPPPPPFLPN